MRLGNFFRVFDTSFFVPGLLLAGGLWYLKLVPDSLLPSSEGVGTVLSVAVLVAGIYAAGLGTHAASRVLWLFLRQRVSPTESAGRTTRGWYRHLETESREELALYFWYTRSTCENVGVVCGILAVTAMCTACGPVTLLFGLGCVLYLWLSTQYHQALERAMFLTDSDRDSSQKE